MEAANFDTDEWEPLDDDTSTSLLANTTAAPVFSDNILSSREFDELEQRFHEASIYLYEGEKNIKFDSHPETTSELLWYNRAHSPVVNMFSLCASLVLLALALFEKPNIDSPVPDLPLVFSSCIELGCLVVIGGQTWFRLKWLGSKRFIAQRSNVVKCVVIILFVLETIIVLVRGQTHARVARCLRPLFLATNQYCVGMRRVLRQTLQSFAPIADMILLLLFCMFMFSIIGFYSFSTAEDPYFATLSKSFVSLFVLITTANYPDVMMPAYSANRWAFLYFFAYLAFGLYFLMNLLLAVVYDTYRHKERDKFKKLFLHKREALRQAYRLLKDDRRGGIPFANFRGLMRYRAKGKKLSRLQVRLKFLALNVGETEALNLEEFYSFYGVDKLKWLKGKEVVLQYDDKIALWKRLVYAIQLLVTHSWFEIAVDSVIIVNTILIVYNAATTSASAAIHAEYNRIRLADILFVTMFWVELCLKLIGLRVAFFKSGWNRFDLLVTIIGTVGLALELKFAIFTSLRQLRILRLFKIKRRYREVLSTMFQLIPKLLSFLLTLMVLFYVFAMIGTELFAGKVYAGCCGDYYSNSTSVNRYYLNNFDNVLMSYVTLFELMVVNNWFVIMNGFVTVTGEWARIYFMVFYLVVVVVALNVVVAFILESFLSRMTFERAMGDNDEENNHQVMTSVFIPAVDLQRYTSRRENEMMLFNSSRHWVKFIGKREKTHSDVQQLLFQEELEQWMFDDMVLRSSMRPYKEAAEASLVLADDCAVGTTLLRSLKDEPAKHARIPTVADLQMPWIDQDIVASSTPRPDRLPRGTPDGGGPATTDSVDDIEPLVPMTPRDSVTPETPLSQQEQDQEEDQRAYARHLAEQERASAVLQSLRLLSAPTLRQVLAQFRDIS